MSFSEAVRRRAATFRGAKKMHQIIDTSPILPKTTQHFVQYLVKRLQKFRAEKDFIEKEQARLTRKAYAKRAIIAELEDMQKTNVIERKDGEL